MDYKEDTREVDLMKYWRVIVKRKFMIITFSGAIIFFTAIFSFLSTPQYRSTATLLIEEETSKILSIEEAFGYQSPVMRDLRFFNTQIKLLKSKSLSERVARKMNLLSRSEFGAGKRPRKNPLTMVKNIITLKWIKFGRKKKVENPNTSNPYSGLAGVLQSNINVVQVPETKLVEVSYTSAYPVLAAEIVNTLAEEFIDFSIEKRYERTQQASDFLTSTIANLRQELAKKEQELSRYGQEKEIFSLSSTESTVVKNLEELNDAYMQAQIERIEAEAAYRELKDVDVESLPPSVRDPMIQQLRADYTRIKNEYEEKSKEYKPNYPEMVQIKARLDSMKEEMKKVVDAAESGYRKALQRERSLKNMLENQKKDVAKMNSSAILWNSLNIEVESIRRQLNSLEEKLHETRVSEKLGGLKASNISIIDKAEISLDPVSPKTKTNILLALFFGIFGGAGLCFLLEYLDNRVKGPEDVERLSGLPSLGVIPYLSSDKKKGSGYNLGYEYSYGESENLEGDTSLPEIKKIELINHLYPKLSISEDYRTVRTSILFSHPESPPKTIVFSSALPMEGKTATVVNMAVSFSQLEEKILVIDSDLRKPRLHRIFKARNIGGLSGYIAGKVELRDAIQKTSFKNIWILPSGPIPPNPAELLNSNKMKEIMTEVRDEFDYTLLDTPPILAVIDPVIVSSFADSTVLVVNPEKLTQKAFLNAVEELRRTKAKIIGVVINGFKVRKGDYYYMDYYHYYPYHYSGEDRDQAGRS